MKKEIARRVIEVCPENAAHLFEEGVVERDDILRIHGTSYLVDAVTYSLRTICSHVIERSKDIKVLAAYHWIESDVLCTQHFNRSCLGLVPYIDKEPANVLTLRLQEAGLT